MVRLSLLLVALAFSHATCWKMEPEADCVPGATRCADGHPEVCSPGTRHRWTPTSSRCDTRPAVTCCPNAHQDGVVRHSCAPVQACVQAAVVAEDGGL